MIRCTARPALLGALLASASSVPAQEAPAPAARPVLTMEVAGPGALRDAFLATNVGNLIGGDDAKTVWSRFFAAASARWQAASTPGAAGSFEAFRKAFGGYRGRARVRLYPVRPRRAQPIAAIVEFLPDGKTDLAELAAGLNRLLVGADAGKTTRLQIGDLQVAALQPRQWLSLAQVHRGRVVLFAGDLETAVGLAAAEPDAAAPVDPRTNLRQPVRLHVDLAAALRLAATGSRLEFATSLLDADQLQGVELVLRPVGPYVRLDLTLTKRGRSFGGLLGALLARSAQPPAFDRLPAGRPFSHLSVSYQTLWETVVRLEPQADINAFVGFDLKTGVIDQLHPGLTVLGDGEDSICLLLRVKDGATAIENIGQLVGSSRATPRRPDEVRSYRGIEIVTQHQGSRNEWHRALHGDRVMLGFGAGSDKLLETAVDTRLRPAPERREPPLLARTARSRPPGCNGVGVIDARKLGRSMLPMMLEPLAWATRDVLPGTIDRNFLRDQLQQLHTTFAKYKLDRVVWYTGQDDRQVYVRFLW